MNFENLNKDDKVVATLKHLANKFGSKSFKVADHWDGDLCAIGLTDNKDKYLVYFSIRVDNAFYVSLENLKTGDDRMYEPAGDFNDVDLETLERIFLQHLQL